MSRAEQNNKTAGAWDAEESTFAAYAAHHHVPLGGTFELTARCSLKCKMCYVRLDPAQVKALGRELTAAEWIGLGKDAERAGMVNLLLTGGEPLLRQDFTEIYSALCQMGFIITLNTNATLMSKEYLRLFSKYPPTAVAVTLYGAEPETYHKICGDPDGFDKTIRGLEMFADLPVSLEVRTTFVQDNMHELDAIRSIANRYTKRYAINVMVNKAVRGATAKVESCRMTPVQAMEVAMANKRYYEELNRSDEQAIDTPVEERMNQAEEEKKRDIGVQLPPVVLNCLATKASCWIAWDGKMLPCGNFATTYTLPLEEGFGVAWERLPRLFETVQQPVKCRSCDLNDACPNCPANLQAETGSLEQVAPYLCEFAKVRAEYYK